ncbi:unnamed protein product [Chondrus crispus]|uniref:Uncharacterized protein n=1 Tax=Chondrus crispus TaxID=2769 RepID=R7QKN7_CHOCR|nr:unnamed protein product [Chondrus crispus]CDF39077.1 unnamed protein product [Chondrus crispus]|eukprot:XP_005718988.1 unnamed protein product [Chondrus crispus]
MCRPENTPSSSCFCRILSFLSSFLSRSAAVSLPSFVSMNWRRSVTDRIRNFPPPPNIVVPNVAIRDPSRNQAICAISIRYSSLWYRYVTSVSQFQIITPTPTLLGFPFSSITYYIQLTRSTCHLETTSPKQKHKNHHEGTEPAQQRTEPTHPENGARSTENEARTPSSPSLQGRLTKLNQSM